MVERIVILKTDGVAFEAVDASVRRTDPYTGKSVLPWIDAVFYDHGVRLQNFYSRGLSLSAPSWAILDTGHSAGINGNLEFDRLTIEPYDYLNLVPYVLKSAAGRNNSDTPGARVLDDLKTPLLSDAYDPAERHVSMQIFSRGLSTGLGSARRLFTLQSPKEWLDEWTIGLEGESIMFEFLENDLLSRLKNPRLRYLDFLIPVFDHTAHLNREPEAQLHALQQIDQVVGKVWSAIQKSPLSDRTVLVLVSDHGMNTDPAIYSQGYNLVDLFSSAAGGGHHVVTNRPPLGEYKLRTLGPLQSLVTTNSPASFYLKGQAGKYPTLLLDADGNERASVYLRHSDLNVLQILWQQLARKDLSPPIRQAAVSAFFETLDRNRADWGGLHSGLKEELEALQRQLQSLDAQRRREPRKNGALEEALGSLEEDANRYATYVKVFGKLLSLRPQDFDPVRLKPEDVFPNNSVGALNSIHHLQNYVVGLSGVGLILNGDGSLDMQKSFVRVNYFSRLGEIRSQNNPQPSVAARPVDFVAAPIPVRVLNDVLPRDCYPVDNVTWLYRDSARQALILSRHDAGGELWLRYLPVRDLSQSSTGEIRVQIASPQQGFPLEVWEGLAMAESSRDAWLNSWHREFEWFEAMHATRYSNGLIDLVEVFAAPAEISDRPGTAADDALVSRFRHRQRNLVRADFIVFANDHWNFNYRGFNPGGNHGAFFRKSTHATLMFAGGRETGIPEGLAIERPYDALSVAPTLFTLTGELNGQGLSRNLVNRGFKPFPGPVIRELFTSVP